MELIKETTLMEKKEYFVRTFANFILRTSACDNKEKLIHILQENIKELEVMVYMLKDIKG